MNSIAPPPFQGKKTAGFFTFNNRKHADQYRALGLSVVPLCRNTKMPNRPNWTEKEFTADDFLESDAIGIKTGWPSDGNTPGYSLVGIDIDCPVASELADSYLPPTGMLVGREGKRKCHRYYLVPNDSIPACHTLNSGSASHRAATERGKHPGPKKYQFRHAETNKTVIDFQASGQQLAAPPTIHPTDGKTYEWHGGEIGEPLVIPYPELIAAVCRLATAAGAKIPTELQPAAEPPSLTHTPAPMGSEGNSAVASDYALYLRKAELPRTGQGGNDKTFRLLAFGVNDLDLPRETVLEVFEREINSALSELKDEWKPDELARILDRIERRPPDPAHPRGGKRLDREHHSDVPEKWDSPQKLAREFVAEHTYRFVKNSAFRFTGGSYEPCSDGYLTSQVALFCERKAREEYHRRERKWRQDGGDDALRTLREQLKDAKPEDTPRIEKQLEQAEKQKPKAAKAFTGREFSDVMKSVAALRQLPDRTDFNSWLCENPYPQAELLSVENGLLDVHSGMLYPHSPEYFTLSQLPTRYGEVGSHAPKWVDFLSEVLEADADRIAILQEFFGACLGQSAPLKTFLVLAGSGDNGKSVVLHVLKSLLGERNTSAVTLDDLTGNRFALFGLLGKLANIVGDQGFVTLRDEGRLKTLTGGDLVAFEQKGRDTLFAVNTAKIIVSANEIPRFNDASEAIWNRLVILPFRYTVPADRKNPDLLTADYWRDELPGILNWAMDGLRRLRANRHQFTKCDVCEQAKSKHRSESNPSRRFLIENVEKGKAKDHIPTNTAYEVFKQWMNEEGENLKFMPSVRAFSAEFVKLFAGTRNAKARYGSERKEHRGHTGVRAKEGSQLAERVALLNRQKMELPSSRSEADDLSASNLEGSTTAEAA